MPRGRKSSEQKESKPTSKIEKSQKSPQKQKRLNIVIPMAGAGSRFRDAGYSFPKPLIDVGGKPMIQVVVENLKPSCLHRFIFICQKEHYDQYSLREILKNITDDNYEVVLLNGVTQGAACTVLTAIDHILGEDDLLIANSDQLVDINIDEYIDFSRKSNSRGTIMTFESSHPKWSYARVDDDGDVLEVAEKKVISNNATVGIYYFSEGNHYIESAKSMIGKDIRVNNEYYVCPVYNEVILSGGKVKIWHITQDKMHGLGTPEDLNLYLRRTEDKQ